MIIKVGDIVINDLEKKLSNSFSIKSPGQIDEFNIINTNEEISIIDSNTGRTYINKLYFDKVVNIKICVIPKIDTKTKNFKIRLVSEKSTDSIDIVGRLINNGLTKINNIYVSEITGNCNPSISNYKVKAYLDQNKYSGCSFSLTGTGLTISDGSITDYELKSRNDTRLYSDSVIARSSLSSIGFSSNTLSITLTNPNASAQPLDAYGFLYETEYFLTFKKTISINGIEKEINFIIYLTYRATPLEFRTIRTQKAIFDKYHKVTIINHDFYINTDVNGKQFSFGINNKSSYSIPTRISYIIPSAIKFSLSESYKPLEINILAQSAFKVKNYYSIKLILEINLPSNRDLVAGEYSIPCYIKARGYKHLFNIPVKLNG